MADIRGSFQIAGNGGDLEIKINTTMPDKVLNDLEVLSSEIARIIVQTVEATPTLRAAVKRAEAAEAVTGELASLAALALLQDSSLPPPSRAALDAIKPKRALIEAELKQVQAAKAAEAFKSTAAKKPPRKTK